MRYGLKNLATFGAPPAPSHLEGPSLLPCPVRHLRPSVRVQVGMAVDVGARCIPFSPCLAPVSRAQMVSRLRACTIRGVEPLEVDASAITMRLQWGSGSRSGHLLLVGRVTSLLRFLLLHWSRNVSHQLCSICSYAYHCPDRYLCCHSHVGSTRVYREDVHGTGLVIGGADVEDVFAGIGYLHATDRLWQAPYLSISSRTVD